MEQDNLKVVLDQKRDELKALSQRLARAHAHKRAGALVRSHPSTQDPIWLDGLHYPAQYVVRLTRSMTATIPRLHFPTAIVDFALPDTLLSDNEAMRTIKLCQGRSKQHKLSSVVKLKKKDREKVIKLLECNSLIAVVFDFSITFLTEQLVVTWEVALHKDVVFCVDISASGQYTLVVIGGVLSDCDVRDEQVKERYSLTCSAAECCSVHVVWAGIKKGIVFCVLCAGEFWSVVALKGEVKELSSHKDPGMVSIRCVEPGMVHVYTEAGLNVYRIGEEKPQILVTFSGGEVATCGYATNGHFLSLTTSGYLYDFIE